jgi:hypothetical protein
MPDGSAMFTLDSNGDGKFDSGDQMFTFGLAGDKFGAGNWSGNGVASVVVERPGLGGAAEFVFDSNADGAYDAGDKVTTFGLATDQFIVGDWNGDGRTKIGVYRAGPNGSAVFSLDTNGDGIFEPGIDQVVTFGNASDLFVTGKWMLGAGLRAADGVVNAPAAPLALDAAFRANVDAAIAEWVAAGLDAGSLARLRALDYQVANLSGGEVGLSVGNEITLDLTAAGHGWSEGANPEPGKMDLTTALAHEMGHSLGLDHSALESDVMFETLAAGQRKAPTAADVDTLFAR